MTQANPIIAANKSGLQYRIEDNDGKRALLNHHKGATAPSYAEAGTMWLDDTATPWLMKMHDGTDWIIIGEVNATTNQFAPYISGGLLGDASTTTKGIVERATDAEVATGTDTSRYITPKQLADNMGAGKVLGQAYAQTGSYLSTTTNIPWDDTIPQNTEGAEALTLSYTPKSATSKIFIRTGINLAVQSSGAVGICALFIDTTADALAVGYHWVGGAAPLAHVVLHHAEISGNTTARTYKLRYGADTGTTKINGNASARRMGGLANTFIEIIEIEV